MLGRSDVALYINLEVELLNQNDVQVEVHGISLVTRMECEASKPTFIGPRNRNRPGRGYFLAFCFEYCLLVVDDYVARNPFSPQQYAHVHVR